MELDQTQLSDGEDPLATTLADVGDADSGDHLRQGCRVGGVEIAVHNRVLRPVNQIGQTDAVMQVGGDPVGDRVGELIGEAQLIYNWEGYPEDVAPLVHAHPTQNEALGEAHLALAGKPLHAHS